MRFSLLSLTCLAATGCALAAPTPHEATTAVRAGDLATAVAGGCGVLAALLALLLSAATALVLASRLPGVVGRVAGLASRALVPRTLRAALISSLALGASVSPVVSGVAAADTHRPVSRAHELPDLDRPATPALAAPALATPDLPSTSIAPTEAATPAPARPTPRPPRPSDPGLLLDRPAPAPTRQPPSTAPTPDRSASLQRESTQPSAAADIEPTSADLVVVRPGDSLWRIAEERLGPSADSSRVAAAWPRWWHANRAVIGDNPDVIRPGQQLTPPTP